MNAELEKQIIARIMALEKIVVTDLNRNLYLQHLKEAMDLLNSESSKVISEFQFRKQDENQ